MKKHPLKTILFDLDGTLIDTEPAAARAVNDCFAEWGIAVDQTDASYVTGRTWASAFEFLFNKYGTPKDREGAIRSVMDRYRQLIRDELTIVEGGADAVRSLAGHFSLALVSGSGRAEILWALERMGVRELFQVILGAEDYPLSKPAPDGYLKALKMLSTAPESGLVFEDSEPGIASGRNAGLWVVAITGTNHFKQNTEKAHHHIPDLKCVNRDWIAKLHQTFQDRSG